MSIFKDEIKAMRPHLSKNSLNTYGSILSKMYERIFPNDSSVDPAKFESHIDDVLEHLENVPLNRKKTTLSALYVLTENPQYRALMVTGINDYNQFIAKQIKTDKQEENWMTMKEIKALYNKLKKQADLLYKKDNKTPADLQKIQNYVILALVSGIFIEPRRSLDWTEFRIRDINKEKDNYVDGKDLVFNQYKTSKFYGKDRLKNIPTTLLNIMKKWSSLNPTDTLLFDSNYQSLTSVKLNQRLVRIFGKQLSTTQLRRIFLSDKFKHLIDEKKEIHNTMRKMGSSSRQLETYVKE